MITQSNAIASDATHAYMQLQRTSDFQAALLGMAGHDLRQPLQVIQSAYELLSCKVSGGKERMRLERGERAIRRLTEQLDRLVGALRLYEHAKQMRVGPVSVGEVLRNVVDDCADCAIQRGIALSVRDTDRVILSDATLLEGILRNLVRNAIKYTEPGGKVLIGCRQRGSDVRIDVYDTGIGMAPEHLPHIFEAFHRVASTSAEGLGIGLFVVRRAVELLGHRVHVTSCPGRGSRFSIYAAGSPA
ncbi:MAG: HAMP domain-containing sensor histidine kinase [Hyphomicrobiaceae bacterium]|nr:HAMP domain-containing sensor histidine kinase [Hyphomicrobiaceae bacterium]